MIESEIGYRGSKSIVGTDLIGETANNKIKSIFAVVKEQRVDGGCTENNISVLRCTLMGFGRNYQKRILSRSINKFAVFRTFYTNFGVVACVANHRIGPVLGHISSCSFSTSANYLSSSSSMNKKAAAYSNPNPREIMGMQITPSFVTGFVDGEGCFSVTLVKDKSYKLGWQVKPKFSIGLHKKDRGLLENIRSCIGVGGISAQGVNGVQFYVNSLFFKKKKAIIEFW